MLIIDSQFSTFVMSTFSTFFNLGNDIRVANGLKCMISDFVLLRGLCNGFGYHGTVVDWVV